MDEGLILRRPLSELERAAASGKGYYSCEQFEDAYGRLVVGVGMRLQGRALRHLERSGRDTFFVSPVALEDGVGFRAALRRAVSSVAVAKRRARREPGRPDRRGGSGEGGQPPIQDTIDRAMRTVSRICPDVVGVIERLRPRPADLAHGFQVADYAGRLMDRYNASRDSHVGQAMHPYTARARQDVFLAGILHDMGRWNSGPTVDHASHGATSLAKIPGGSVRLRSLAPMVAEHHRPLSRLNGGVWDSQKTAALALAEAVVESPSPASRSAYGLGLQGATATTTPLLVTLSNLEGVAPPGSVVRIGTEPSAGRPSGGRPTGGVWELAVSLRVPDDDPAKPCLLRFAHWVPGRGLEPLLGPDAGQDVVARHLTGPGHPALAGRTYEVVSFLQRAHYEAAFGGHERLVPAFRVALERRHLGERPSA